MMTKAEREAVEKWPDKQIEVWFESWEELLDSKEGNPEAMHAFIDEVRVCAQQVVGLVRNGGDFDEAVSKVKAKPGAWLGVVPWVEVKRQAREILAG